MRAGTSLTAIAAAACLSGAIALQVVRDRMYPAEEAQISQVLYLTSGPALQRLALEYDALVADVYWIRALQYYGGNRLVRHTGRADYRLLYQLLDLTTTLDPHFNIAYRFGAIFLSEGYPEGPARPDQAVALLRKAIAARPGTWQYYMDIAFVYYWHVRDYRAAAEWMERAHEQPGAPDWLRSMAAIFLTHGEDRASARFLWQQIARSEEETLRLGAQRALLQLDALDAMDVLERIVRSAPPPQGERYSWTYLVQRGRLRGVPLDPTGTPFELDPVTGHVQVSRQSPLFPMPRPKALS